MIRLLVFLVTGFWWTKSLPPVPEKVKCVKGDCRALGSDCSSGFCLVHCNDTTLCLCGVGRSAAAVLE